MCDQQVRVGATCVPGLSRDRATSYFRRDELISRHNATPLAPEVNISHTRHTENRQRVGSRTFAAGSGPEGAPREVCNQQVHVATACVPGLSRDRATSYFRRDELISRHKATPPAPKVHTSHTRHTENRQRVGSRTFAAQMWAKRERRTARARDWAGAEGGRWREG